MYLKILLTFTKLHNIFVIRFVTDITEGKHIILRIANEL